MALPSELRHFVPKRLRIQPGILIVSIVNCKIVSFILGEALVPGTRVCATRNGTHDAPSVCRSLVSRPQRKMESGAGVGAPGALVHRDHEGLAARNAVWDCRAWQPHAEASGEVHL